MCMLTVSHQPIALADVPLTYTGSTEIMDDDDDDLDAPPVGDSAVGNSTQEPTQAKDAPASDDLPSTPSDSNPEATQ